MANESVKCAQKFVYAYKHFCISFTLLLEDSRKLLWSKRADVESGKARWTYLEGQILKFNVTQKIA